MPVGQSSLRKHATHCWVSPSQIGAVPPHVAPQGWDVPSPAVPALACVELPPEFDPPLFVPPEFDPDDAAEPPPAGANGELPAIAGRFPPQVR